MPGGRGGRGGPAAAEDSEEEKWDDWVEEADDEDACMDLFSSHKEPSSQALVAYMTTTYDFDLRAFCLSHDLDTLGLIKLVNYIRGTVGTDGPETVLQKVSQGTLWQEFEAQADNDDLLKPVLDGDTLLMFDIEDDEDAVAALQGAGGDEAPSEAKLAKAVEQLQAENGVLREELSRRTARLTELMMEAPARPVSDSESEESDSDDDDEMPSAFGGRGTVQGEAVPMEHHLSAAVTAALREYYAHHGLGDSDIDSRVAQALQL